MNIISCSTPQMTNAPIEAYVGDKWKIHNGRDELYRFNMTTAVHKELYLLKKY